MRHPDHPSSPGARLRHSRARQWSWYCRLRRKPLGLGPLRPSRSVSAVRRRRSGKQRPGMLRLQTCRASTRPRAQTSRRSQPPPHPQTQELSRAYPSRPNGHFVPVRQSGSKDDFMRAITFFAAILALTACASSAGPANPGKASEVVQTTKACGPRPTGRVRSFRSSRLVLYRSCKARAASAIAENETGAI